MIVLALFYALSAHAMNTCGVFEGDVFVKSSTELVLDHESHRQIILRIPNNSKLDKGTNATIRFTVLSKCFTLCDAKIEKIVRILEPYEEPRQFEVIGLKPIEARSCR